MPTIRIDVGQVTKEKKAELIAKLTDAAQGVLGIPKEAFTVYIRENNLDNIGSGGVMLSEKMKK